MLFLQMLSEPLVKQENHEDYTQVTRSFTESHWSHTCRHCRIGRLTSLLGHKLSTIKVGQAETALWASSLDSPFLFLPVLRAKRKAGERWPSRVVSTDGRSLTGHVRAHSAVTLSLSVVLCNVTATSLRSGASASSNPNSVLSKPRKPPTPGPNPFCGLCNFCGL